MPVLLVLLAALLWGTIGPVSKFAFRDGISALETAFWRGGIASVFLLAHATWRGKLKVELRDFAALAGFGLVGVALLEGSYLLAVEKGGAALASVLLYSAPLWVALVSGPLFGERLGPVKLLALATAFAGIVGVAWSGGVQGSWFSWEAVTWGLVSGLSYASFYIFGKHFLRTHEPITLLAWAFPFGCLGLFPFVEFAPKTLTAWTALATLGFASTYVAYFVYYVGLRSIEPTRASVIASIEPVVAMGLAWAIWGEKLSFWGYFWAAWVIAGVLLMVKAEAVVKDGP